MLAATAFFSAMDALLKVLSAYYPPVEVAALRGLSSLPFLVLAVLVMGRLRELGPGRFGMHLFRGLLMCGTLGGFIYAVRVLSLADAYAIFLAAPLIVTALSGPILKERVGVGNWVVIIIGLLSVIAMLRPSASSLITLGALGALLSAMSYAAGALALRVLTQTDSTASIVLWTIAIMTVLALAIALPTWQPLRHEHWVLLAGLGLSGALGQSFLTEAFRSAPPPIVAPFEYLALLWGMGIDRVFWGVLPTARVLIGGGVVVACGLYVIWHERNRPVVADSPHT